MYYVSMAIQYITGYFLDHLQYSTNMRDVTVLWTRHQREHSTRGGTPCILYTACFTLFLLWYTAISCAATIKIWILIMISMCILFLSCLPLLPPSSFHFLFPLLLPLLLPTRKIPSFIIAMLFLLLIPAHLIHIFYLDVWWWSLAKYLKTVSHTVVAVNGSPTDIRILYIGRVSPFMLSSYLGSSHPLSRQLAWQM